MITDESFGCCPSRSKIRSARDGRHFRKLVNYRWVGEEKNTTMSKIVSFPLNLHQLLYCYIYYQWCHLIIGLSNDIIGKTNIKIQPVSHKRYFRCNNCFLLLVFTINLSRSTDLVDPPPMGTFYMKHALPHTVMLSFSVYKKHSKAVYQWTLKRRMMKNLFFL